MLVNGAYDLAKHLGKESLRALRRIHPRARRRSVFIEPLFDPAEFDMNNVRGGADGTVIYSVSIYHREIRSLELTYTADDQ
jgi:hypothetical protein